MYRVLFHTHTNPNSASIQRVLGARYSSLQEAVSAVATFAHKSPDLSTSVTITTLGRNSVAWGHIQGGAWASFLANKNFA